MFRRKQSENLLLPRPLDEWATRNRDFLVRVYGEFSATGDWPARRELQRDVVREGGDLPVSQLAHELPRELGHLNGPSGDQIVLHPITLAYIPEARPLLDDLVRVLDLARQRLKSDAPLELSRSDLVEGLGIGRRQATLLSQILLKSAPFLGGGGLDPTDWTREISVDGLVPYLEIETTDDYLRAVAQRTAWANVPRLAVPLDLPDEGHGRQLTAAVAVVGVTAALIPMALTLPWAWSGVVVGLALSPLVWPKRLVRWPPSLAGLLLAAAAAAVCSFAAAQLEDLVRGGDEGPRRFIVHIDPVAGFYGRLRPNGPPAGKPPHVNGQEVAVVCRTTDDGGVVWDQIADGTFIPDEYLVPVAGESRPPPC